MILFVHLATSDLLKRNLPLTDPAQPWVCGLAAELASGAGEAMSALSTLVRPDPGMQIRFDATARHGISTMEATQSGISAIVALGVLCQFAAKATIAVGHSNEFDRGVVESVLMRAGKDTRLWTRPGLRFVDTMTAATPFCRIEPLPPREDGQFKWPSLAEASSAILGEALDDAPPPIAGERLRWNLGRVKRLFLALNQRGAFGELEAA